MAASVAPRLGQRESGPGGEYVGLEEIDEGEWDLYFGRMKLGRFHEPLRRIEDDQGRLARKRVHEADRPQLKRAC
jgi:hypothetical protein